MAAFTTRANVKVALGIPAGTTRHDGKIDLYLDGIDNEMLGILGQSAITQTVYAEVYDVDGPRESSIQLRHWPATAVAALSNDDSLVAAADYYIEQETQSFVRLKGAGSFFANGRQKVSITYTAGYAAVPGDLTVAATLLVVSQVNGGAHAGLRDESSAGYAYTRPDGSIAFMPPEVASIVARRRPAFR